MKTRILLASLALLATGCGRDGSSEKRDGETAVQVASKPFTIGNEVTDQMGTHVGDMGTDRDGDPALNALAEQADVPIDADGTGPAAEGSTDGAQDTAGNSQFTTEGGPEG